MCERYNTTPEGRGIYAEAYQDIHGMQVLGNIYNTVSYLRTLQGAAIHRLTDPQRRILRYLLDEGLWQM